MLNRARHSAIVKNMSRSFVSYDSFKNDFPIIIRQTTREPSAHEKYINANSEWFEKIIFRPISRFIADSTANLAIDSKFPTGYMSDRFLVDSKICIVNLFDALRDESMGVESTLNKIVTPELYAEFKRHFAGFDALGLKFGIRLNSAHRFERADSTLCFGSADDLSTTLNKAQIHTEITPASLWRHNAKTGKWFYSEAPFEYVMSEVEGDPDKDLTPLSLRRRSELARKGTLVGLEVRCDVDFTVLIQSKDDPSKSFQETIKRPMIVRFEAPHLGKPGSKMDWVIADIDNVFGSKLFEP